MSKRNYKYGKTRKTLDKRHQNYIEHIKELQTSQQSYERTLQELWDKYQSYPPNSALTAKDIYEKNKIYQSIKETEEEKENKDPQKVELEYFRDVSPLLVEYYQNGTGKRRNAEDIENEYLEAIDPDFLDDTLNNIVAKCPYCYSKNVIDMLNEYIRVCQDCGSKDTLIIENDKTSYNDSNNEISYCCYKRSSHLSVCLQVQQGKETTEIPQYIFDELRKELSRQRIEWKRIPQRTIRDMIDKFQHRDPNGEKKYSKYKINAPLIWSKLTGNPLPQLSPELENKLLSMFKEVEAVFPKYIPNNRKNLISYTYIINRLLHLLGETNAMKYFKKPNNKEKLLYQESIWKSICHDLGWPFYMSTS